MLGHSEVRGWEMNLFSHIRIAVSSNCLKEGGQDCLPNKLMLSALDGVLHTALHFLVLYWVYWKQSLVFKQSHWPKLGGSYALVRGLWYPCLKTFLKYLLLFGAIWCIPVVKQLLFGSIFKSWGYVNSVQRRLFTTPNTKKIPFIPLSILMLYNITWSHSRRKSLYPCLE